MNPFEIIGLSRSWVNHLKSDPGELRRFLQLYRRTQVHFVHPDTSSTLDITMARINHAYDHLFAHNDEELMRAVEEYLIGTPQEVYGIRLELISAQATASALEGEVRALKGQIEDYIRNQEHGFLICETMFQKVLQAFTLTSAKSPVPGHYYPADMEGMVYFDHPKRSQSSSKLPQRPIMVTEIRLPCYYFYRGCIMSQLIKVPCPSETTVGQSMILLRDKVAEVIKELQSGTVTNLWVNLGIFIGSTDKHQPWVEPLSFRELVTFINHRMKVRISTTTQHNRPIEYLVSVVPTIGEAEGSIKYKVNLTLLSFRSFHEPVKIP